MRKDYLPGGLGKLANWLRNFDGVLMQDPSRLGVGSAAAAWHAAYLEYVEATRVASSMKTRTPGAITTRQAAEAAVTRRVRVLVAGIQARPETTDTLRKNLRISVPRPRRRRVGRPDQPPRMRIAMVQGRRVTLTVDDATGDGTARRRRRPAGAMGVQVFRAVGEQSPTGPDGWSLATSTNQTKVMTEVDWSVLPGTRVWWTARWVNARSEAGPACVPVASRINSGW